MLRQRDVADFAGIDRSIYNSYVQDERDYYPIDVLNRIATMLEVDMQDLFDDYNRFLYNGQGHQIRALRKNAGLTQHLFGKMYGVSAGAIKRWENDRVQIFKNTWEKIFK